MRCVLLQRVHRHDQQADWSAASAVLQIVQNLRLSWAKRNGINHCIRPAKCCDHLGGLGCAAVVAGLADQQNRVAVVILARLQQPRCVGNGIER